MGNDVGSATSIHSLKYNKILFSPLLSFPYPKSWFGHCKLPSSTAQGFIRAFETDELVRRTKGSLKGILTIIRINIIKNIYIVSSNRNTQTLNNPSWKIRLLLHEDLHAFWHSKRLPFCVKVYYGHHCSFSTRHFGHISIYFHYDAMSYLTSRDSNSIKAVHEKIDWEAREMRLYKQ